MQATFNKLNPASFRVREPIPVSNNPGRSTNYNLIRLTRNYFQGKSTRLLWSSQRCPKLKWFQLAATSQETDLQTLGIRANHIKRPTQLWVRNQAFIRTLRWLVWILGLHLCQVKGCPCPHNLTTPKCPTLKAPEAKIGAQLRGRSWSHRTS